MTGGIVAGISMLAYDYVKMLAIDPRVDSVLPWPLRKMLEWNAAISKAVFGTRHLAPEFSVKQAGEPRTNGQIGLSDESPTAGWRLQVTGPAGAIRSVSMAEIRQLPKVEMVTELNCVEGWSQVVHWGGARLVDFLARFELGNVSGAKWTSATGPADLLPYIQLATPDHEYYVGLDMPSAIHPQTLLCYEMNGQPLTAGHGAPLRLVITVKYGIKSIKRIGHLRLATERPGDYWGERGYDWFAGL